MALKDRGFVPKYFGLEVASADAGWLQSVSGGDSVGAVVTESIGASNLQQKHISGVTYNPINVTCGAGMNGVFEQWIKASFSNAHKREPQGAIHACDTDMNVISSINFFNALITSLGFPACDAAGKDPASISIGIQPEYSRMGIKGGSKLKAGKLDASKQKHWTNANFSLKIDGHPDACKHVSKVDAITISQATVVNPTGETRDSQIEPAALAVPNLVITASESHADSLYKYHEDFVVNGNCTSDKELTGSLEYLAADLKTILFTLNFKGLGIFGLTPDALTSSASAIRNVKASFYCEEITWSSGTGTWA